MNRYPQPRSVAQRQEANALGALQCGFESLHSDQRIYFATRLKRANSTNIAAEFAFLSSKSAPCGCSSEVEHLTFNQRASGSNPDTRTKCSVRQVDKASDF